MSKDVKVIKSVISKKKKKASKITPEQRNANKVKASHIRSVRSVFRNVGFERVPELSEKDIEFLGQAGEFDDCWIYENLIVLVEYTTTASSKISDHIKHKKIIFDNVTGNHKDFLTYLKGKFPDFEERLRNSGYHADRLRLKIVYCSRYDVDESIKVVVDAPAYLDFPVLKYFEKITASIKLSALAEFSAFLGINQADIGYNGSIRTPSAHERYHGSILPEEASGFPDGYKVVSFYADADALLKRAYVLRPRLRRLIEAV